MVLVCNKRLTFSFPEILEENSINFKNYEHETLAFCNAWVSNQSSFEIPTSGSTGKPKIISVSREQMIESAQLTTSFLGLTVGDKALVCLNTKYIAGKMMLVRGFETGMDLVITSPVANPLKRFPRDTHFDFTALVPYQIQTIMQETPEKIPMLNKMKAILIGGAPVSPEVEDLIKTLKAPVYSTYGMTETVSHIALRKLNGNDSSSAYHTLPGVMIDTDARNCLKIKSPVTLNEWIQTNDIVKIVDDQKFIWIGRADNIINSGGIKIQVEELENKIGQILNSLSISNRFFVTGSPDIEFGTVAVLIMEGKIDEAVKTNMIVKLKKIVSRYEFPKRIIEIDRFEETQTGKIDRLATKALIF